MARSGLGRAAAALALFAGAGAQSPAGCSYNFGNSTFSLAPLRSGSQWGYSVFDGRNNVGSMNYTYFINICADVPVSPSPNGPPPAVNCSTTYPGTGGPMTGLSAPAPAYQWANVNAQAVDKCHRLGQSVAASPASVVWGLYDNTNPSRGVSIQYTGGDVCPGSQRARSLRIWLLCYDDAYNVPDAEVVLETPGTCLYEIFLNSAYGCPAECPLVQNTDTGERHICARHGVCDFDGALGTSRCFCNDGWVGADCATPYAPPPGGLSSTGIVLILVCLLLVGTLAFLLFLWGRIRGLRLDPSAYSSLRAGPDETAKETVVEQ